MLCTGGTRCRGAGQPLPTRAGAAGAHGPSPRPRCQHPAPRRRHPPTPRHQRCRAPGTGGRGGGVSLRAGGVKGGESGGVGERARPPRVPRACQACGGSAGCSRGPQACPSTPAEFGTARHGTARDPRHPNLLSSPPLPSSYPGGPGGGFYGSGGGQVPRHRGVLSCPCTPKGCCWEPVSAPPFAGSPRASPPQHPAGRTALVEQQAASSTPAN